MKARRGDEELTLRERLTCWLLETPNVPVFLLIRAGGLGEEDAGEGAAAPPGVYAARERRLPPEVWALRADPCAPLARHYLRDPRVTFRAILAREPAPPAVRGARRALSQLRRDAHFVDPSELLGGLAAPWRFARTEPVPPPGWVPVRHRVELPCAS